MSPTPPGDVWLPLRKQVSGEKSGNLTVDLGQCGPIEARRVVQQLSNQTGEIGRQRRKQRPMTAIADVGDGFAGRSCPEHRVSVKAWHEPRIEPGCHQPQRDGRCRERIHVEVGGVGYRSDDRGDAGVGVGLPRRVAESGAKHPQHNRLCCPVKEVALTRSLKCAGDHRPPARLSAV
jgi:hypothetical protein